LADLEIGVALLFDRMWMGVAGLVSCRSWIEWDETHSHEGVSSGLYLRRDTRTILWVFHYSPCGIGQLESCSPFASKPLTMAMAVHRAAPSIHIVFPYLSRAHLQGKSNPLALASGRSDAFMASDV
jgi:hypothetical protein